MGRQHVPGRHRERRLRGRARRFAPSAVAIDRGRIDAAETVGPPGASIHADVGAGVHRYVGKAELGGITAQVVGSSSIRVPKAALVDMLSPVLDRPTLAAIEERPRSAATSISPICAAGVAARVEGTRLEIVRTAAIKPPPLVASQGRARASDTRSDGAGRRALGEHNGDVLGEIQIRSSPSKQILLTKSALVDILTPVFEKDPSTLKRLVSLPDQDDQVTLDALQSAGLQARFNDGRIEFGAAASRAPRAIPNVCRASIPPAVRLR